MSSTPKDIALPAGKLAAIMFTDIVGYTSMMGDDETKALAMVDENQAIQKPLISKYRGTLLKEMGDGNLICFESATDAIHCALNIQQELKNHPDIKLRIGIHLGEVIFKGNDVYGDGVNIASRIESMSEAGGICISGAVQQAIRGKKEIKYEYLGQKSLKGVDFPVKVFALSADYLSKPKTLSVSRSSSKRHNRTIYMFMAAFVILVVVLMANFGKEVFGADNKKEMKMAIIPFVDVSGNDEMSHLGLGFANSVKSKLSLSKQFDLISSMQATMGYANTVKSPEQIGRELNVNFLLTGIYQIVQDIIKVNVELVDVGTGASVWNISYDEALDNIFAVQSKIANQVLENFTNVSIVDQPPTANLDAYSLYTKGLSTFENMRSIDSVELDKAKQLFISAVALDSSFEDAWVKLIDIETSQIFWGQKLVDKKIAASHVTTFEDRFRESWNKHLVRGLYLYKVERQYDDAFKLFEEVLNYDPENEIALLNFAAIQKRRLEHKDAISNYVKLIQRNQTDGRFWEELGIVLKKMGDYESAEKAYRRALELGRGAEWAIREMQVAQGLRLPESQENNVNDQLAIKLLNREYLEILEIVDHVGLSEYQILDWKATVHFLMGQDDSHHYAQEVLAAQPEGLDMRFFHLVLGNRDEGLQGRQQIIDRYQEYGDDMNVCNLTMYYIQSLTILGEFEEATQKIIDLNQEYPAYGEYLTTINQPFFDKIKEEYPPFLKALDNLQLPPRIRIETLGLNI